MKLVERNGVKSISSVRRFTLFTFIFIFLQLAKFASPFMELFDSLCRVLLITKIRVRIDNGVSPPFFYEDFIILYF